VVREAGVPIYHEATAASVKSFLASEEARWCCG
jgi:hypothetical protein